jgi:hypothetical protein
LESHDHSKKLEIPVTIAAVFTELGDFHIHCLSKDDPEKRWNLRFQLRNGPSTKLDALPSQSASNGQEFDLAMEYISRVFGKKSKTVEPRAVKTLRSDLENQLGPRQTWNACLARQVFDHLFEGSSYRRRSVDHERLWLNLAGFCLRPGFGINLDQWRVQHLWPLYGQGIQYPNEIQSWSQWWTLWRRISGGLEPTEQQQIYVDLRSFVDPIESKKGNIPALAKKRSLEDILRLLGSLERLDQKTKITLGESMLKLAQKEPALDVAWWAVGRIAARVPLYGTLNNLIPADIAESWLDQLTADYKKNPRAVPLAATMIGRVSGDRSRDINENYRDNLIKLLRATKSPLRWITLVSEKQILDQSDQSQIYGETLPAGLKLLS